MCDLEFNIQNEVATFTQLLPPTEDRAYLWKGEAYRFINRTAIAPRRERNAGSALAA